MINVTIGEYKPEVRPFPKLMRNSPVDGWIGYFPDYGVVFWLTGPYKGKYSEKVNMEGVTDYNEPITIQNA